MSTDTATRRRRRPGGIQPRPSPQIVVSAANWDAFLQSGDVGLRASDGHFLQEELAKIEGSRYVHVVSVQLVNGVWMICESAPPAVSTSPLAETVAQYPGLVDVYRHPAGQFDPDALWDWQAKAVGRPYSFASLWKVWRRRYRLALAAGRCGRIEFPSMDEFCRMHGETVLVSAEDDGDLYWNAPAESLPAARIPQPIPNCDNPTEGEWDCSGFRRCAERVNWLADMKDLIAADYEFDCDVSPADFSVLQYVCSLTP
jgi:hypothetical protein